MFKKWIARLTQRPPGTQVDMPEAEEVVLPSGKAEPLENGDAIATKALMDGHEEADAQERVVRLAGTSH